MALPVDTRDKRLCEDGLARLEHADWSVDQFMVSKLLTRLWPHIINDPRFQRFASRNAALISQLSQNGLF